MKNYVVNNIICYINRSSQLSEDKEKEVKYGLEALYMNITKIWVILVCSILLDIFLETTIFLFLFNNLRIFGFGVHANKSIHCWISSLLFFVGFPYISPLIVIPFISKFLIFVICIIVFLLYAPADTEKHPLINKERRLMLKEITVLIALIYCFGSLFIFIDYLGNLLLLATLLEALLVSPVMYKIFQVPYNNYLSYKGGERSE